MGLTGGESGDAYKCPVDIVIVDKLLLDFRVIMYILSTHDAFFVICVLPVSDAHNDVDCIVTNADIWIRCVCQRGRGL